MMKFFVILILRNVLSFFKIFQAITDNNNNNSTLIIVSLINNNNSTLYNARSCTMMINDIRTTEY